MHSRPTLPQAVVGVGRRGRWAAAAILGVVASAGLMIGAWADEALKPDGAGALPRELARNAQYASSSACRDCHAEQYESWHHSYHRTMTQVATPGTVVGKFDGSQIDSDGLLYRVFTRNGELMAEMPDPDVVMDRQATFDGKSARGLPVEPLHWRDIPRVERRVSMSTGSHHYQTYWVESKKFPGTLMTLPLVYLIEDQRWIPREAAFLYPPGPRRMVTVWNDHCINCHSTGPVPSPFAILDPQTNKVVGTGFHSKVADVGISCEACHGPGLEHVRMHRAAAGQGESGPQSAADPIVHPGKLPDHRRSAQVCGQCHGVYVRDRAHGLEYSREGIDYTPGNDLFAKRQYIFPPQDHPQFYASEAERQRAVREFETNQKFFRQLFWDNGDPLAGGREFTGLSMSSCYIKGEMTCLSCHSMHDGDPNDQLIPGLAVDQACIECHLEPKFRDEVTAHTHHAADSAGSSCVNCHMPHTTYALFGAIRTHKIDSPDLAASAKFGVPNACNLCHLDRTLAWTASQFSQWYGTSEPELTDDQRTIAASLLWMVNGHAAQRVILAWHVGWEPAQQASGKDWLAPMIAPLLADPYGAVRHVAAASLRTLPGFEKFSYDFMAPAKSLVQSSLQAINQWRTDGAKPPSRLGEAILIGPDGALDELTLKRLIATRDNRPVTVSE